MENLYLNKTQKPAIISVVSTKSGMGKTTLIERLIKIFKDRKYSVGVLKYNAHKFDIDKEGKDSYRFTKAGADNVIISSADRLAMIQILQEEKSIEETIELFGNLDIVLLEGFKKNKYPKIEVHRKSVDDNLLCKNPNFNMGTFIAVASDEAVETDIAILNLNIAILNLNDVLSIADFIEYNFIK